MFQTCIAPYDQHTCDAQASHQVRAQNSSEGDRTQAPLHQRSGPATGRNTQRLTAREKEIIFWISRGKTDWQMAQILQISAKTVNFHVERIKHKLSAVTRAQAADIALRSGLLLEPVETSTV